MQVRQKTEWVLPNRELPGRISLKTALMRSRRFSFAKILRFNLGLFVTHLLKKRDQVQFCTNDEKLYRFLFKMVVFLFYRKVKSETPDVRSGAS
ncbi:hypothetical protein A3D62_01325 [Candidatus Kaiserbacteria bacterium RIFCSPHIGHO2_02_FULL_49_11]|uniref:Uncharacterized protein n=1 Tax=Candidatus Kaiserbacteria bacterium RIFCSPHIGHO2_02_FULL_49_11 TaxID=1798489 RepID=A0A1F6CZG9_9BACT|nr:MAG: hypothetical protein A3D62_01325 [Candidatus Kaiserbacteria bacterium RIFCSPHIGHO2_02_FULL_49_11]